LPSPRFSRQDDAEPEIRRRRGNRLDDDEPFFTKRQRHRLALPSLEEIDVADGLIAGDRWSTWDQSTPSQRGPEPYPDWLVTELAASDTELGILKTGKEADVFLVRRAVPDTDRSCLLAAKRYRSSEHRLFHRDSQYLEGRRVRESRDSRAMANRTTVGRQMIAVQWADAEFAALCQFHLAGVPVPYPVQVLGTELLLEFIGEPDGTAAPRLAESGRRGTDLAGLWEQLVESLSVLARLGLAHGDLSAYNLLLHRDRLIMIDVPQVVDVIANPRGAEFLDRDAANVGKWFVARGLAGHHSSIPGPDELAAFLRAEARLT
jgi:RIO kinase 1